MIDNFRKSDLRGEYKILLKNLRDSLKGNTEPLKIKKKTISNLFRYDGRKKTVAREIDLSEFDRPLFLDKKNRTLEVEGLTTWQKVVEYTLPRGFLPLITPELKHITVGGSTVGIGIESNTHKYGFVHNSLLEADILLPNGEIITSTPRNKYQDLFHALGNSYGTLGYVLRAKIKLRKTKKYIALETTKHDSVKAFLRDAEKSVNDPSIEHVEGLAYSKNNLCLTIGRETDKPKNLKSIYGNTVFYKEISRDSQFTLTTEDYIFRYDPDWFWNLPESPFYKVFRKIAPKAIRNSGFYTKYTKLMTRNPFQRSINDTYETLIQDWEVPMKYAGDLMEFVLSTVDLDSKPLMVAFVRMPKKATLYPLKKNSLYLNLGSYSFAKRKKNKPAYYYTKIIDDFCFKHNGIKMLYSSTFLKEYEFDKIYNGADYKKLKQEYDPLRLLPTLFEKTVKAH